MLAIVMLVTVIVLAGVLVWVIRSSGSPTGRRVNSNEQRARQSVGRCSLTHESEAT